MSANEGKCLIHCEHLATENANLTPLSQEMFQQLLQSRDAIINLGGAHVHEKQMNAILKCFFRHLSPLERSKRATGTHGTLFPNVCMKCKSSRPLKVKGKKQFIRVLQTFSACKTVKLAAAIHSDDEMLPQVTGEDLIAKEFKMHSNCYKEYTRVCSKQSLGGVSSLSVDKGSESEIKAVTSCSTHKIDQQETDG